MSSSLKCIASTAIFRDLDRIAILRDVQSQTRSRGDMIAICLQRRQTRGNPLTVKRCARYGNVNVIAVAAEMTLSDS